MYGAWPASRGVAGAAATHEDVGAAAARDAGQLGKRKSESIASDAQR